MNIESSTGTMTMIQCPTCKGTPYGTAWAYCLHCGGRGWVPRPAPVEKDFQITINPPPPYTINGLDPALWAFLARFEQKLDRLLAALEDGS